MTYSIAEAAAQSALSADTLRYYEKIGLIDPPARDTAGRRLYTDDDLHWLQFLTNLRTTGMPVRAMTRYAALRRHGNSTASRRKAMLTEQRDTVAARIAELQACLQVLDRKIAGYELREQAAAAEAVGV